MLRVQPLACCTSSKALNYIQQDTCYVSAYAGLVRKLLVQSYRLIHMHILCNNEHIRLVCTAGKQASAALGRMLAEWSQLQLV